MTVLREPLVEYYVEWLYEFRDERYWISAGRAGMSMEAARELLVAQRKEDQRLGRQYQYRIVKYTTTYELMEYTQGAV